MSDRLKDGTSAPLTVDSATSLFEQLLSADESTGDARETPPATEPAPDTSAQAADTPSDASDEPAAEQEPADAAEHDEPNEPEPPQTFTVSVDGKEVTVTLDELRKGYLRQSDYTRKTQAVAEEKKALDPVKAERAEYAAKLAQLDEQLSQGLAKEPDWDALQRDNPDEFPRVWAQWQRYQQHVTNVRAEREKAEQRVNADRQEALQQHITSERTKLLEAIPAWKDTAVAKKEQAELVAYGESLGLTSEQLAQVVDATPLLVLRKAMLYDKAQEAKPAVRQKIEAVKVATPGPANKKVVSEETRLKQRLAKTGKAEDAAALFETML